MNLLASRASITASPSMQGAVSVTEGHGGKAVDRASVARQLSEGFLGEASGKVVIVATPDEADVRIGADEAAQVADEVQAALDRGCTFSFEQTEWPLGAADLGAWVRTRVEERGEGFALVPYLDETEAASGLLGHHSRRGLHLGGHGVVRRRRRRGVGQRPRGLALSPYRRCGGAGPKRPVRQ